MVELPVLPPDRWERLRALLDEAMTLPPDALAGWLERLDAGDAELRPRLAALVAHLADGTASLPIDTDLPRIETSAFAPRRGRQAGETVGPYRLLRELGQGGMASVWLAERSDMLQARQVALKLPHGPWLDGALDERLQREREILATLEHPHIARLYDAGVDADGQPWLALEWVQGERIDAHAERQGLPLRERLALVLQVARAVAHAHARLVVHRDLKPANILVDGQGQVKLLDFGIAKLLDQGVAESTELTHQAGRALTPQYASPEQLRGLPLTTATDVYSLGMVLYELSCGVRPWASLAADRPALEQAVLNQPPLRPSQAAPDPARARALRGDLDTIVLKCLKKEPAERYATVDALADDLERYLQQRPVLARPDSAAYRLRRFVARNRLAVGASAAVALALCGGSGLAWWQASQAQRAQQRAEAVKTFVSELLYDTDPYETRSEQPTVRALLEAAHSRLPPPQPGNAALRVELLTLIAGSLAGLSAFDRAAPLVAEAIAEGTRELGPQHELTLQAQLLQATLDRFQGRADEGQRRLEELMPELRRRAEREPQLLRDALTMSAHLAIDQARFADARERATEALALSLRTVGPDHRQSVRLQTILAQIELSIGDPQRALATIEDAVVRETRLRGGDVRHAEVVDMRMMRGRSLLGVGRFEEAQAELASVLADGREVLGDEAALPGFAAGHLARAQLALGEAGAALRHADLALSMLGRNMDAGSSIMAVVSVYRAVALTELARHDEALRTIEPALQAAAASRGPDHPQTRDMQAVKAQILGRLGRAAEGSALLEPRLAAFRATAPPLDVRGLHVAGQLRRLQGDLQGAGALQREALDRLPPDQPARAPLRDAALVEQARLALAQGQATPALALLDQLARPLQARPPRSFDEAERQRLRAQVLVALGRTAEAQAWQEAAGQGLR